VPLQVAVPFARPGGGQAVHDEPQLSMLLLLEQALPHR
jgi:hypothetical protein